MDTATYTGYTKGIGAITGAFTSFMAGKMEKLAYNHQAAMAEIQAQQIDIDTSLMMADKTGELAKTLSLQNVMAAASGRSGGGSLEALQTTSRANLGREETRLKAAARSKKLNLMMDASTARLQGKAAAQEGLLGGLSYGVEKGIEAMRYIK